MMEGAVKSAFEIGTARAAAGETSVGVLKVAVAMDAREVTIPVGIVHGARPGPVVLVEGGLHGIEIATVEICRLLKERIVPANLAGTLVLAPQVNPWAFLASSRFTPHDSLDMNRVFPGAEGGTLTHQVARVVTRELLNRADVVIDCHSCNPPSLHFTIVGEEGNAETQRRSVELAKAFGYPVVCANTAYSGTLSGYCLEQGKPTITPEFVFSRRFDRTSVETGVTGVLNVLKHLNMLDGAIEPLDVAGAFGDVLAYRSIGATNGGFCFLEQECGVSVKAGDTLAVLRDFWGRETERILAPQDGIVIAYPLQGNQAAGSGDKVAYLAYRMD
ncbi:succinylglutamate desuccinylase/aspartoacylase family protein [Oceanibium sediminis]|uniref:succinylglutamate desuccinylase/aspartoacylase family protein n=1 Tax=Oceanibium sediminis TaxID=2026339 RepID=UPI000DD3B7DA|nr:succinylglutamate desuccinylase/aspartoacylase family protein [Oceanibium sediminis]